MKKQTRSKKQQYGKDRKYKPSSPEFYQWLDEFTEKNKELLKELGKM